MAEDYVRYSKTPQGYELMIVGIGGKVHGFYYSPVQDGHLIVPEEKIGKLQAALDERGSPTVKVSDLNRKSVKYLVSTAERLDEISEMMFQKVVVNSGFNSGPGAQTSSE